MEYFNVAIRLTSKRRITKKHLWNARLHGVRLYGNISRRSVAYPKHYIHARRLPFNSKFDDNEHKKDARKGYKLRNSGPLISYGRSSRISSNFPSSLRETRGASMLGISNQIICKGIRNPELEDLPKYSPEEREKPKLSWWKKLFNFKKEEEIEEYCGEPISLEPEDIEDEIKRQKCLTSKKTFIHPLVDRIGCKTPSFQPKDMPGPFNCAIRDDNDKLNPPTRKSWIKNLFNKEPKTVVVYPPTIPQAKVITYEELCYSIKNMLMTPARYDCSRRYPDLCFQEIPTPFYSGGGILNCAPNTAVSPPLRKSTTTSSTPRPPSLPSQIQGPSHQEIFPAPPRKMACDGKTPINAMSPPFYSECTDPPPRPSPFFSECKNDSSYCQPGVSAGEFKETEPRKQPQKFYSECTPQIHPANKPNKNQ